MKDKAFVYHLYDQFNALGFVGSAPYESTILDHRSGKRTTSFQFGTFSLPCFVELNNRWYRNVDGKNVKILPSDIGELLTPRALAYWLSGDGSYCKSSGRIQISTDSFSPGEVDLLRSILLEKYHIESTRNVANRAKEQFLEYKNGKFLKYRIGCCGCGVRPSTQLWVGLRRGAGRQRALRASCARAA